MFNVHHTNFGNEREFETFEEAEAYVRITGFEASIWDMSRSSMAQLVATFSPISGLRDLRPFAGKTG